jgi:phi13 family phage major tail protein
MKVRLKLMSNQKTVEFRGCDGLVYAEVTADDLNTPYVTGTVKPLAPVAEISKTVENSSETHYYDNVGMIIIRSEGSDEVTLTVPALPLNVLAELIGKQTDPTTGAFIDGEAVEKYFAIGYRLRLTDGTYRYVWRLKGSFSIPDETSATENDGTDTNNQELTYTGVKTVTKFDNGGRAKAVVVDERDGLCDVSDWFDAVVTPDTVGNMAKSTVTAVSVSPTTASVAVGAATTIIPTTTPAGANVVWKSSNNNVATVANGVVTGVAAGTAVITASAGNYAASCTVTVTAE